MKRSQKGQAVVESILILAMLMGFTFAIASYFKSEEVVKQLISGPWKSLAGMLQNGVWGTPEATVGSHPTTHSRHLVILSERAQ